MVRRGLHLKSVARSANRSALVIGALHSSVIAYALVAEGYS
jgi:hypothetical protein